MSGGPLGRGEPLGDDDLMVEQNARLPLRASDSAHVLSTALVVLEGAQDVLQDEAGRKAYLG
jgi:ABC-type branched-subunit amino acid transport system ATPase component